MLRFKQQYIISHLKFEFELFNSPGVEEMFDNGQIFYKTFQLSPLALYFPKKTKQFLFIYQACSQETGVIIVSQRSKSFQLEASTPKTVNVVPDLNSGKMITSHRKIRQFEQI